MNAQQLRCYAYEYCGCWIACCVDLAIHASGRTKNDAMSQLDADIGKYLTIGGPVPAKATMSELFRYSNKDCFKYTRELQRAT